MTRLLQILCKKNVRHEILFSIFCPRNENQLTRKHESSMSSFSTLTFYLSNRCPILYGWRRPLDIKDITFQKDNYRTCHACFEMSFVLYVFSTFDHLRSAYAGALAVVPSLPCPLAAWRGARCQDESKRFFGNVKLEQRANSKINRKTQKWKGWKLNTISLPLCLTHSNGLELLNLGIAFA